jgi:hypothetical protein
VAPPPGPLGPPPPGPPPTTLFQDRNGPLLKGDPLLDRPGDPPPGWFAEVDVGLLGVHVKNALVAPVKVPPFGTDLVHVPGAELDWTGVPRLAVGYRLDQGCGEFLVSYRTLETDGNADIPNYDVLGDGLLHSRLNLNVLDLDYASREYSLAPCWDMKWLVGCRVAGVFYDSRVEGLFEQQRVSNNFVGAGPHLGLALGRYLGSPGLRAYGKVESAFLLGQIRQSFEETFTVDDSLVGGGATDVRTTQAVPVLAFETGLSWEPEYYDHMRFTFGYQFEQWWYLGQTSLSRAELTDQGIFFRSEFNF